MENGFRWTGSADVSPDLELKQQPRVSHLTCPPTSTLPPIHLRIHPPPLDLRWRERSDASTRQMCAYFSMFDYWADDDGLSKIIKNIKGKNLDYFMNIDEMREALHLMCFFFLLSSFVSPLAVILHHAWSVEYHRKMCSICCLSCLVDSSLLLLFLLLSVMCKSLWMENMS